MNPEVRPEAIIAETTESLVGRITSRNQVLFIYGKALLIVGLWRVVIWISMGAMPKVSEVVP
jgi:hypothetical protein